MKSQLEEGRLYKVCGEYPIQYFKTRDDVIKSLRYLNDVNFGKDDSWWIKTTDFTEIFPKEIFIVLEKEQVQILPGLEYTICKILCNSKIAFIAENDLEFELISTNDHVEQRRI